MAYSKRALGLDPSLWAAIPHDLNKKMMDLSHKSGVSLLLLPPPSQPWSITALPFGQCQIILLGNRGSHVWTSCPRSLHDNERPGVEPATSRSLVRFHHYTPHNAVAIPQSGTEKKVDHHAVCVHNLRKLLLNNGFILVDPYSGDDKINILCNIVHVKYSLWRHSWCHRS